MTSNSITKDKKVGRRPLLGAAAAALSAVALAAPRALAQSRQEIAAGEDDRSASNPGPVNRALVSCPTHRISNDSSAGI